MSAGSASWSPECDHAGWLGPGDDPRPGARFTGHNRLGDWEWTVTCVVTEAERPRVSAWTVLYSEAAAGSDPGEGIERASSFWRYDLHPGCGGHRGPRELYPWPWRQRLADGRGAGAGQGGPDCVKETGAVALKHAETLAGMKAAAESGLPEALPVTLASQPWRLTARLAMSRARSDTLSFARDLPDGTARSDTLSCVLPADSVLASGARDCGSMAGMAVRNDGGAGAIRSAAAAAAGPAPARPPDPGAGRSRATRLLASALARRLARTPAAAGHAVEQRVAYRREVEPRAGTGFLAPDVDGRVHVGVDESRSLADDVVVEGSDATSAKSAPARRRPA